MNPYNRKEFLKAIIGGSAASIFGTSLLSRLFETKPISSFPERLKELETQEEWEKIRSMFPLERSIAYFNTASLGASPLQVLDTINENLLKGEIHAQEDHNNAQKLKTNLAQFIGCNAEDIAFTRNATEGLNIVARELSFKKGDEIIITSHEHVGGASPWIMLEKEIGVKVNLVELDLSGKRNFELIKAQINSNTKLLCISHVTCTTGMILPIKEISEYCNSHHISLCVDGAQSVGLIPVNLKDLDVDFYTSSGHKWLFGPKGTGFLYVNKRALPKLKPLFAGAYADRSFNLKKHELEFVSDISRLEYGTRNTPILQGLIESINFHNSLGFEKEVQRNEKLAQYLKSELKSLNGVNLLSPTLPIYSTSMVTFQLKGMDYILLRNLLLKEYNHKTRGIYENDLKAIRVSIAIYNNKEQIDQFVRDIREISDKIQ